MEFQKAKEEFIQTWAALGTSWGINKTMAQIFALLIISPKEKSVEEIMEELQISRGNASMNIRQLIDWELIEKIIHKGDRKEYFHCERDVWAISRKVAEARKNREIAPVIKALKKLNNVENQNTEESKEFVRVTSELIDVIKTTDNALNHFIESERSWVSKTVLSYLKSKKD